MIDGYNEWYKNVHNRAGLLGPLLKRYSYWHWAQGVCSPFLAMDMLSQLFILGQEGHHLHVDHGQVYVFE